MSDNPFRLPRSVSPQRYDLVLEPDLEAATFRGTVAIAVEVHEPTSELVLNALDLVITEAAVEADGGRADARPALDEATERLHLALATPLPAGPAVVHLAFTGRLNDKLKGWYRSTFTDASGETRTIATTQMQSTDCRRAFPCWDEPDFKAVFGVTLIVPEDLLAISNGPEIERSPAGEGREGKVRIRFADTMKMSSYLVAFVVGPLVATEPVDVRGTPLRVVHVPGKERLTAFALEVGAFALQWFEDYYGISYPGDKVDLVALPDFAFGAMENLGCVTFRETALLVDPNAATQQEEQMVADVVSHELAHMWFGDLVTMKWWNGIWLNEAFATFMEVAAVDAFRPEWQRWTSFGLDRTGAFEVDSLTSTRPVEYAVVSPKDAEGMFDVLTYEKGCALLRMLEQYLGTERFRDGIRHYLATHSYANTETGDLWDALEHTSGEPVRRIMDSWIWQGGYPLVTARPSDDGSAVVLSQHRFLFEGEDATRWSVPVLVAELVDGSRRETKVLLEDEPVEVALSGPDRAVVVNAGAHGFFRVHYEPELLARLTGRSLRGLSTAERYALADDAWASVVSGAMDADAFTNFARGYGDEPAVQVWQIVLAGLRWCDRFIEGSPRRHFQAFVRALVAPALHRVGFEPTPGEDDLTGELRGVLFRTLGILGDDPAIVEAARRLHAEHLASPGSVDPTMAAAAVAVISAHGTDEDYEAGLQRFRTATTPQDQVRELYSLADYPSEALVRRSIDLAFSDAVKTQNAPYLIGRCLANRDQGALAWRLLRERWDEAVARFPDNSIVRMIDALKTLSRPEEQADVAAFFAERSIPQGAKQLAQILERQGVNVAMRQREAGTLTKAFS